MAGWSLLSDGSSLDCGEILHNLPRNGFCLDLSPSLKEGSEASSKDKLRCLFDQIISIFLKEISQNQEIRLLPVMLGDGRLVDLFKLYRVVREKGGYDMVTENGSWASVAEESGLGLEVGSSVKLIYVKYLNTLDRWLPRILKENGISSSLLEYRERLGLLSIEMEKEINGLFFEVSDRKKNVQEFTELDSEMNELKTLVNGNGHVVECVRESAVGKGCGDGDDDEVIIIDECVAKGEFSSRKRKRGRESLLGMVNWVKRVAKNPGDPATGKILEGSKQKVYGVEYWAQAILARQALRVKRNAYLCHEGSLLLATEKLRGSTRLLSLHRRSPSGSTSAISDNDMQLYVPELENDSERRVLRTVACLSAERIVGLFCKDQLRKRVPIGPLFQSEVPNWIGPPSESDESKWLGTQQWPPQVKESELLIDDGAIGKGRPNYCGCKVPGSVECVRFHVAEKRLRLKLELGSAFNGWRFNHMGEEVSLSWTDEEERRFKSVVLLNPPSLNKNFWDQAYVSFPSKRRRDLVSYYFNVFLLRRRSYQNRVTPKSIDSDNDEMELGFLSNSYGLDSMKVSGSNSILCAQNKQSVDLEESTEV
ncbi:AT-rich interactive domain-containing protein 2-like [Tasmannia lanceolata]|uniref:AT-rich interactive domain-containing protein 2-like n=1 Tax=Tasmannia lanceolata TaxID=3420 RepID=UPI0040636A1F